MLVHMTPYFSIVGFRRSIFEDAILIGISLDSGHGGQTKDLDGDEADGYDEVIYPVDFQQAGHIVDDILHDIMVKPLPPGCRLTAIFDVGFL